MASIITLGMREYPILTKRAAGESMLDAVERHVSDLLASVPTGDKLMTTWQVPGGQKVVTTIRLNGESHEALRERHLSIFLLG